MDAKNGTPISTVAWVNNGISVWNLFCGCLGLLCSHSMLTRRADINQDEQVRHRVNSNTTNTWVDGTLNDLDLVTFSGDQVGMLACWYGNPDLNVTTNDPTDAVGIRLWYPPVENVFQEISWRPSTNTWTLEQNWSGMNGHASPACFSWGDENETYVIFVDLDDQAVIYW